MAGLLAGRVALVTGGGSGIGAAACKLFAAHGARVAVVDVNEQNVQSTCSSIGDGHHGYIANVGKKNDVQKLMKEVCKQFNAVPTIGINCAGITRDQFLLKMEESDFDEVINVNLKGTWLISQALAQTMVENNATNGSIVNVASIVGKVGNLGQTNYAASKSAISGLTKTIAKELARNSIRCNAILPGFIKTPMAEAVPEKVISLMKTQIPMQRLGTPDEVANLCLFLASDQSSYITGACIEITGGLHM